MQDRFKVRYWVKGSKEYLNSNKLVYNDGTFTQVSTKQLPSGKYVSYILYDWNTFDLIPEQCTGLKDKNGKLIYEGDIVRTSYPYAVKNYEVKWGDCCWELRKENGFIVLYEKISEALEVIGNIHENPDLLENKDE